MRRQKQAGAILILIQMDKSEAIQPLQELVRTFNEFIQEAVSYINEYGMYGSSLNKTLYDLLLLWIHPKGVVNLIKSITLEYANDSNFPPVVNPQSLVPLSRWQVRVKIQEGIEPECTPQKQFVKIEEQVKSEEKQASEEVYYEQSEEKEGKDPEVAVKDLEVAIKESEVVKEDEIESSYSYHYNKSYKRGPYKRYTVAEKLKAVNLYLQGTMTITDISKLLGIPCKNIKRWAAEGIGKKIGGGRRRSQPDLQTQISIWLNRNFAPKQPITISQIQEYALSRIDGGHFKASRGWALKFIHRHSLRQKFSIR